MAPGLEQIAYFDMKFNTPSNKIELQSATATATWHVNPLPTYESAEKIEDEYPFHLLSPNTKNRIHSQFGNLEVIRQFAPEATVILHALDAIEKGIDEGDKVRVFNAGGETYLKADLNFSIKRGCVVIYNGIWIEEGGTSNLLSKARETDMGHGTAFHDCMVNIEKAK